MVKIYKWFGSLKTYRTNLSLAVRDRFLSLQPKILIVCELANASTLRKKQKIFVRGS
ncbi:hypothetical protein [Okeania sp. KiyG1]|uniref:hypothetical protein n=1 Tax=Okeania sp. KiyG1 TaxID=2720165 RepID=UPI001923E9EF|nr:hypothetical protein [Okeania sp. KiyG1]